MPSLASWIELSRPYIDQFGWLSGLRIGAARRRAIWADAKGKLVPIRVPGMKHVFFVRAGSQDMFIFDQVFVEHAQFVPLKREPRTILDLGANIGLTSIQFANRFPAASILAVEPEPDNFALLERNTRPYKQVRSIQAGVWSRDAHLRVTNPDASESAFQVAECDRSTPGSIAGRSVPSLMEAAGFDHVDLVKIDIEGSEVELFSSGRPAWMDSAGVIMVELHDRFRPGCSSALQGCLRGDEVVFEHSEFTVVATDGWA